MTTTTAAPRPRRRVGRRILKWMFVLATMVYIVTAIVVALIVVTTPVTVEDVFDFYAQRTVERVTGPPPVEEPSLLDTARGQFDQWKNDAMEGARNATDNR